MASDLDAYVPAYTGDILYDFDNRIILSWYPQRIIAANPAAGSLLELGLGHGYATSILSQHFERHVALDGSPAVIANFRATYPQCRVDVVETYFETFDTEERFDVVLMGFILEHVDDPVAIMRRFRKFIAPGGKMYVSVPNAESLNRRLGHLAGFLEDLTALSDNDRLLGHQRYYTVKTFADDIARAGFKVERLEGIYLKPLTTQQMVSLNLDEKIIQALCKAGKDYPELCCGIMAEIAP